VMAVCLIAGLRIVNLATLPLALLFMGLIACVFAALGTAIGSALENMQGFQLVMNFLVLPIFFLSGALYPLNNLPKIFSVVTSLDPLAYGVDALRTTLIGISHFGLVTDVIVLGAAATVLLIIGSWLFSKVQV
jgi:ABC-2 type transport system permease protein